MEKETKKTGLVGFNPAKFIELLLKLDGYANSSEVEVVVRKKDNADIKTA